MASECAYYANKLRSKILSDIKYKQTNPKGENIFTGGGCTQTRKELLEHLYEIETKLQHNKISHSEAVQLYIYNKDLYESLSLSNKRYLADRIKYFKNIEENYSVETVNGMAIPFNKINEYDQRIRHTYASSGVAVDKQLNKIVKEREENLKYYYNSLSNNSNNKRKVKKILNSIKSNKSITQMCESFLEVESVAINSKNVDKLNEEELLEKFIYINSNGKSTKNDKFKRQIIMGLYDICKKYESRPDLFYVSKIAMKADNKWLMWSREYNKIYTACSIHRDLLFPVRYIIGENIPYKYLYIDVKTLFTEYDYLGTINVRVSSNIFSSKFGGTRNYYTFIFVHKKTKYVIFINYRLSYISQYEFRDTLSVSYYELNQFCYYLGAKLFQHKRFSHIFFIAKNENIVNIPSDLLDELIPIKCFTPTDGFMKSHIFLFNENNNTVIKDASYNLRGGNNVYKFKIKKSKKYIKPYDISLVTIEYKQFLKIKKRFNDYSTHKIEWDIMFNLVFSYYPYEYINPRNIRCSEYKKSKVSNKKRINISYWLGKKIDESILMYQPITDSFTKIWEFMNDIASQKRAVKYLELSTTITSIEAFYHFREKFFPKYKDTITITLYNENDHDKGIVKLLNRFIKFKIEKPTSKYDIITINPYILEPKLGYFWEQSQTVLAYNMILTGLQHLKDGGNMLIILIEVKSKLTADILLILKSMFETVELKRAETQMNYKQVGITVLCKKYNGNLVTKEMLNIQDKLDQNFNICNNSVRNKYNIKTNKPKKCEEYVTSIIDLDICDPQYDWIRNFNKMHYINVYQYIDNVLNTAKDKTTDQIEQFIQLQKEWQLINSIQWARKFDLDLKSAITSTPFVTQLGVNILSEIYQNIQPKIYKFKSYKAPVLKFEPTDLDLPVLDETLSKYILSTRYIDTRNIELYDKVSDEIRYFKRSLTKYLTSDFKAQYVSQGWIKMYEMLKQFNLLSKNKEQYVFFLCEAPGAFIMSTNHYVRTETNSTSFNWLAQSLNPYNKKAKNMGAVNDTYKLIKKYKDNWDFGVDNTGDITNPKNIKHYQQYIKAADLITSDCGMAMSDNTFKRDLNISEKIFYGSVLTVLNGISEGANALFKNYMELTNIKVSLIYILYCSFKSVTFYKSVQNVYSPEFYIICKDFKGINRSFINHMFKFLDKFDYTKSIVPEYSKSFKIQFMKNYSDMVNDMSFTIERTLFYVDNYDKISKSHKEKMNKFIDMRNKEWIRYFTPKKIDKKYQL